MHVVIFVFFQNTLNDPVALSIYLKKRGVKESFADNSINKLPNQPHIKLPTHQLNEYSVENVFEISVVHLPVLKMIFLCINRPPTKRAADYIFS